MIDAGVGVSVKCRRELVQVMTPAGVQATVPTTADHCRPLPATAGQTRIGKLHLSLERKHASLGHWPGDRCGC